MNLQFHKTQSMRYGENPHQSAAFYTVTEAWFLALERNIAGPPMSMFSIASSKVQSGLAIVA
jgi:phosphoribosylaminoimidazolecarboxamide formyltransferase/IMP cyclohydrolase